jgi:hypothetical protein
MIETLFAMLLSLSGGNDEPKPAKAAPKQGDVAKLTADELKKLKENNIFSPPKKTPPPKKPDEPKKTEPRKEEPPPPKMLSVTGFFRDETEGCFKVLIEDRTWKDNKYKVDALHMLKAGEEIAGGKIVEIRLDSFDHQAGETKKTYHAGEQIEVPGSVSSGPAKAPESTGPQGSQPTQPTNAEPDPKAVEDKMKELRERFRGKRKSMDEEPEEELPGKKKRG